MSVQRGLAQVMLVNHVVSGRQSVMESALPVDDAYTLARVVTMAMVKVGGRESTEKTFPGSEKFADRKLQDSRRSKCNVKEAAALRSFIE